MVNHFKVVLYSSIKEMPVDLAKKFQRQLLQDLGIGNTIEDVDDHLARLMQYVSQDKKTETIEELKNLRFNLFTQLSEWSFKSLAFGCLIQSVNDQPVLDYSEDGLQVLISKLSEVGLTVSMVEEELEDIKKKLIRNGNYIFPTSSDPIPTTLNELGNT